MKKPSVHVTDHAVIRYLERVMGLDVEALRREIGRKAQVALEHPGATGVVVEGFAYRLVEGRVVTIAPRCQPDRHTGHTGRKGGRGRCDD